MNSTGYNGIRKDISPESTGNPLAWMNYVRTIAQSLHIEDMLYRAYPEDTKQIRALIALEAANAERLGWSKEKITRHINKLWRDALKSYGFESVKDRHGQNVSFYQDVRIWMDSHEHQVEIHTEKRKYPVRSETCAIPNYTQKNYVKCSIPYCTRRAICYDERYGKICDRCRLRKASNLKRGLSPYTNIERPFIPSTHKTPGQVSVFVNKTFFVGVQHLLTDTEWQQIWFWVKGHASEVPQKLLDKLKHSVHQELIRLPKSARLYKKRDKAIKAGHYIRTPFLELTCTQCGERFEVDTLYCIRKNLSVPEQCPKCNNGVYYSPRVFRLAKLCESVTQKKVSCGKAASITGFHYNVMNRLVSTFRNHGITGLGKKIDDPYFKVPRPSYSPIEEKIEWQLRSSLHPSRLPE